MSFLLFINCLFLSFPHVRIHVYLFTISYKCSELRCPFEDVLPSLAPCQFSHSLNFRRKNSLSYHKNDLHRIDFRTNSFIYSPYRRILVPRGRAPFGQHQESRPLAKSNTGSPRFTDFPSLCACSESSLTNLIGSGLNLLCLQSHSKAECRWTRPEVAILGADQKERGLWGRE